MKVWKIVKASLPVLIMIALIPLVTNDYVLVTIYLVIITASFSLRKEKHDIPVFIFGFIALTISESLFISTGVEVFIRKSLFGIMPLWLPILWGYAFVAIKRSIEILNKD
jgi:hypothetical protein